MSGKAGKIYAFIDSQNLNLSILNDKFDKRTGELSYKGWKLDFGRFFIYLQDKYLQESGYILIHKPTLEYSTGKERIIKGNVDAELILHTMIELPNFSKAIIIAGDGDYYCLIEYLEMQKKLSRIIIPNKTSYSSLLRKYSAYFVYVTDLRGKLEYRK